MFLVVLGFFGLMLAALFFYAEMNNKHKAVGLLAAILLIMLGIWHWGDPAQVQTGIALAFNETINQTNPNLITTSHSEIRTDVYSPVTVPFFNFALMLSMFLICAGLIALFKYASEFYLKPKD
jgi:hypothetical protein